MEADRSQATTRWTGWVATRAGEPAADIVARSATVIHAPKAILSSSCLGLLAEGHLLIEDVPGRRQDQLAKALARSIDGDFSPLQFTPDLLPSDITGVSVCNQQTGDFEFRPGPVFANLLLADEINRASPKTQSALLEAMEESQVTVDGVDHPLQRPFLVIATQNPIEYEGTYPLPEAQLDRFTDAPAARLPGAGRRGPDARRADRIGRHAARGARARLQRRGGRGGDPGVREVFVDDAVCRYVVAVAAPHPRRPAPVRSARARARASRSCGWRRPGPMSGRDYVVPDDVKRVAEPVLAHRLLLAPQARSAGHTGAEAVAEALEHTPIPV